MTSDPYKGVKRTKTINKRVSQQNRVERETKKVKGNKGGRGVGGAGGWEGSLDRRRNDQQVWLSFEQLTGIGKNE